MAHTSHNKQKLINRIRRIRGQLDAVERALDEDKDCSAVLHTIVACRGAMSGLVIELLEGHVRSHVLDSKKPPTARQADAAEDLLSIIKTYLR